MLCVVCCVSCDSRVRVGLLALVEPAEPEGERRSAGLAVREPAECELQGTARADGAGLGRVGCRGLRTRRAVRRLCRRRRRQQVLRSAAGAHRGGVHAAHCGQRDARSARERAARWADRSGRSVGPRWTGAGWTGWTGWTDGVGGRRAREDPQAAAHRRTRAASATSQRLLPETRAEQRHDAQRARLQEGGRGGRDGPGPLRGLQHHGQPLLVTPHSALLCFTGHLRSY